MVRPYYAYSPSGAVTGTQAVYYLGREEDYHALRRVGVDVKGCVADYYPKSAILHL